MLENVIVLGSKGHCQLEEERIIYEEVEAEGDNYPEYIEDEVEELEPAISNNEGKRKRKRKLVKVRIH